MASRFTAPGERWYSDPGAIPNEPYLFLDIPADAPADAPILGARAAIIEREGTRWPWQVVSPEGVVLGVFAEADEAKRFGEERFPPKENGHEPGREAVHPDPAQAQEELEQEEEAEPTNGHGRYGLKAGSEEMAEHYEEVLSFIASGLVSQDPGKFAPDLVAEALEDLDRIGEVVWFQTEGQRDLAREMLTTQNYFADPVDGGTNGTNGNGKKKRKSTPKQKAYRKCVAGELKGRKFGTREIARQAMREAAAECKIETDGGKEKKAGKEEYEPKKEKAATEARIDGKDRLPPWPWTEDSGDIFAADEKKVATVNRERPLGVTEAIGRLIVAAPKMKEALMLATEGMSCIVSEEGGLRKSCWREGTNTLHIATEALELARGKRESSNGNGHSDILTAFEETSGFAEFLRSAFIASAREKAIDWKSNVAGWIEGCVEAGGIPMFRLRYAGEEFPGFVLAVCWGAGREYRGQWFRDTPAADCDLMRKQTGEWREILAKYKPGRRLELTPEARKRWVESRLPALMRREENGHSNGKGPRTEIDSSFIRRVLRMSGKDPTAEETGQLLAYWVGSTYSGYPYEAESAIISSLEQIRRGEPLYKENGHSNGKEVEREEERKAWRRAADVLHMQMGSTEFKEARQEAANLVEHVRNLSLRLYGVEPDVVRDNREKYPPAAEALAEFDHVLYHVADGIFFEYVDEFERKRLEARRAGHSNGNGAARYFGWVNVPVLRVSSQETGVITGEREYGSYRLLMARFGDRMEPIHLDRPPRPAGDYAWWDRDDRKWINFGGIGKVASGPEPKNGHSNGKDPCKDCKCDPPCRCKCGDPACAIHDICVCGWKGYSNGNGHSNGHKPTPEDIEKAHDNISSLLRQNGFAWKVDEKGPHDLLLWEWKGVKHTSGKLFNFPDLDHIGDDLNRSLREIVPGLRVTVYPGMRGGGLWASFTGTNVEDLEIYLKPKGEWQKNGSNGKGHVRTAELKAQRAKLHDLALDGASQLWEKLDIAGGPPGIEVVGDLFNKTWHQLETAKDLGVIDERDWLALSIRLRGATFDDTLEERRQEWGQFVEELRKLSGE